MARGLHRIASEVPMRDLRLSIPGLGLLLAGQFSQRTRKKIGVALLVLGALTTIPVFIGIRRRVGANGHVKPSMNEQPMTTG
jgi:hypothetical protein